MDVFSSRDEHYYEMVKDYLSKSEYLEIINGFSEYDDIYRTFIPYDVFDMLKIIKIMKFNNPLFDALHLVLLTSIIELLIIWVDHASFSEWYKENEEKYKNKKCMRAWNEYIIVHGKQKKFKEFFIDFKRDEKFNLLHSIKKKNTKDDEYRPFCYQGTECDYGKYICKYKSIIQECPAYNDEKILNKGIKKFAEHLYHFRSIFVHEARLPRFAEVPPSYHEKQKETHIRLKPMTMYNLKEKKEYLEYYSEFSVDVYYELVMGKLVSMMKKYLNNVKN